jgi:hypothetical protein
MLRMDLTMKLALVSGGPKVNAVREDGVVPVTSALRGRTPFAIWAADHADLIGHDLDGPTPLSAPKFDYLRAYEHIIRDGLLP